MRTGCPARRLERSKRCGSRPCAGRADQACRRFRPSRHPNGAFADRGSDQTRRADRGADAGWCNRSGAGLECHVRHRARSPAIGATVLAAVRPVSTVAGGRDSAYAVGQVSHPAACRSRELIRRAAKSSNCGTPQARISEATHPGTGADGLHVVSAPENGRKLRDCQVWRQLGQFVQLAADGSFPAPGSDFD